MNSRDIFLNLDFERRKRGYTIKELSTRCGISARTWTGYKMQPEHLPLGVIEKAANVMMIPLGELLRGRRQML